MSENVNVTYAVKVKNEYICTVYNNSTSEANSFDGALKCKTIEEACAIRDLAMRRNSYSPSDYHIIKRETVLEEVSWESSFKALQKEVS